MRPFFCFARLHAALTPASDLPFSSREALEERVTGVRRSIPPPEVDRAAADMERPPTELAAFAVAAVLHCRLVAAAATDGVDSTRLELATRVRMSISPPEVVDVTSDISK